MSESRWHVWLSEEEIFLLMHSLKKIAHVEEDKLKESALLFDKLNYYMSAETPTTALFGVEIMDVREVNFLKEEAAAMYALAMEQSDRVQELAILLRIQNEQQSPGG